MTPDEVRALALTLPGATESAHMGHPDFRCRGKIFATLQPEFGRAMVKLSADEQALVCEAAPAAFAPVPGGWGRRGATYITLDAVDPGTVLSALRMALAHLAEKRR